MVRSLRSGKELHAQLNDRGIQGINCRLDLCQEAVVPVEHTRSGNQAERQVLINLPRSVLVSISKGGP